MGKTKEKGRLWQEIAGYMILIVLIGFLVYGFLGLKGAELAKYPLSYSSGGDGLTGLVTAKSMWQNGWIYKNPYLGAPYDGTNYDATTMEILLSFIEQVLIWITGNWILSYNLFYLSAYFLIGITAYYTLRQLDIHAHIALPTAILYAFAPYHQMRGMGHLYLGMYFMVPLMVLYMYRFMKGEPLFCRGKILFFREKQGWLTGTNLLRVLCLICMALTGIYYAFFACFFFCVVLMYRLLNHDFKKESQARSVKARATEVWKMIAAPCISVVIIVVSLLVAAIPNFVYWMQNGRSEAIASKGSVGAELYGLKIIQLILPISGHRISLFARLRNLYDTYYPLVNENGFASMGIIMAAGFMILCLALFMGQKLSKDSNIWIGAVLTLAAILFGTIGGFAVVLSFFTGAIRCYNRLSIFIAMFSLIAVAQLIQNLYQRIRKPIVICIIMLLLLVIGMYDQTTPVDLSRHAVIAEAFEADADFIQEIEQMETEGAMIYQMPYMKYPENGGIQNMQDYAHLLGYLHSDSLCWSYGAIVGREGDQWMQSVNELPLSQQLQEIQDAGFAGVYVDWNAYLPDERTEMEKEFSAVFGDAAVISRDGTLVYYTFHTGGN